MPAKSKAQQRFFGMVHAYQKGELKNPSKDIKDVANSISKKSAKDFAETKHKKLPNHVKKSKKKVNEMSNPVTLSTNKIIKKLYNTLSPYMKMYSDNDWRNVTNVINVMHDVDGVAEVNVGAGQYHNYFNGVSGEIPYRTYKITITTVDGGRIGGELVCHAAGNDKDMFGRYDITCTFWRDNNTEELYEDFNYVNNKLLDKIRELIYSVNESLEKLSDFCSSGYELMRRNGEVYLLTTKPTLSMRGYIIIPFENDITKIKVFTKHNGRIILYKDELHYDYDWRDAKKILLTIKQDAERTLNHFREYDPSWEDEGNKEAVKDFNRKNGFNVNANLEYVNENSLNRIIKESITKILNEDMNGIMVSYSSPTRGRNQFLVKDIRDAYERIPEDVTYFDITRGYNPSEEENLVSWGGEGGYFDNRSKSTNREREKNNILRKKIK